MEVNILLVSKLLIITFHVQAYKLTLIFESQSIILLLLSSTPAGKLSRIYLWLQNQGPTDWQAVYEIKKKCSSIMEDTIWSSVWLLSKKYNCVDKKNPEEDEKAIE